MKLIRKTKRLIIRPLEPKDFEAWRQAQKSQLPKKNAWDSGPPPINKLSKAEFSKILKAQRKSIAADSFYSFAIFRKSGELVGQGSLMDISRLLFQNAYLGYRIFNNQWENGYASEAIPMIIDIAFKELKLHRIEAGIEPHNRRSIRLARSIGLRKEGFSRRRIYLDKKWIDLVLYAATSEDFGIQWEPRS